MNQFDFEKIEMYVRGEMDETSLPDFERELASNAELAETLQVYRNIEKSMRDKATYSEKEQALINTLNKLNEDYFNLRGEKAKVVKGNFGQTWKMITAVAAMFVLLLAGYFLFTNQKLTGNELATDYVHKEFSTLSQTMDGSVDLQKQGIAAYNNKEYNKALGYFESAYKENNNAYLLKYMGIVYLVKEDYDQAFKIFDQLEKKVGLFSNPGKFLKAVTLLSRNKPGDLEQAKVLLQKVVNDKSEGSDEAATWLQKL